MIVLNGTEVSFVQFPDGQWHCDIEAHKGTMKAVYDDAARITASLTSFEEVVKLLLLVEILDNLDIDIERLYVPYLIGSRMDRRITNFQPATLKVIMGLLKDVSTTHLTVLEPHSDVIEALVPQAYRQLGWDALLDIEADDNVVLKRILKESKIVTPDAGMHKKIARFCNRFRNWDVVEASKVRNVATGEITETKIFGDVDGRDCLVVDDLCDGGRTFIELAKVLKAQGANNLYLAVCHGVFSNDAVTRLLEYYTHIYTTNSYRDLREVVIKSPQRITVIDAYMLEKK